MVNEAYIWEELNVCARVSPGHSLANLRFYLIDNTQREYNIGRYTRQMSRVKNEMCAHSYNKHNIHYNIIHADLNKNNAPPSDYCCASWARVGDTWLSRMRVQKEIAIGRKKNNKMRGKNPNGPALFGNFHANSNGFELYTYTAVVILLSSLNI